MKRDHITTNEETGVQEAVFDLAWPDGLQFGLSQPVAVLLNKPAEATALAGRAGSRFFTEINPMMPFTAISLRPSFNTFLRRSSVGSSSSSLFLSTSISISRS